MKEAEKYKIRILVSEGMNKIPIDVINIAYVFSEHKISFVRTESNKLYIADQSLNDLEKELNPNVFYRVNRQYIVNRNAIGKYKSIEQSKILLELKPKSKEDVVIGKENAVVFRKWVRAKF